MDPAPAGGFIAGANKPVLVAVDQRTSVTEVCLPSRLHSVSPCRTSHSSASRSSVIRGWLHKGPRTWPVRGPLVPAMCGASAVLLGQADVHRLACTIREVREDPVLTRLEDALRTPVVLVMTTRVRVHRGPVRRHHGHRVDGRVDIADP